MGLIKNIFFSGSSFGHKNLKNQGSAFFKRTKWLISEIYEMTLNETLKLEMLKWCNIALWVLSSNRISLKGECRRISHYTKYEVWKAFSKKKCKLWCWTSLFCINVYYVYYSSEDIHIHLLYKEFQFWRMFPSKLMVITSSTPTMCSSQIFALVRHIVSQLKVRVEQMKTNFYMLSKLFLWTLFNFIDATWTFKSH